MKLLKYFDAFLADEVNLNKARLDRLDESVSAVTNFLSASNVFAENFIDVVPQGSYAHKTIIKPVKEHDEFDADLLLSTREFDGWTASDYVNNLYDCFRDSGVYKTKVSKRTRCVTIDYADDFHIDVVPYLERHSSQYITNCERDLYELTNPEGYNIWLDERNRTAGRNLTKVIRLVKYIRDHKQSFSIKSVVLNVLLGQQVNDAEIFSHPGCYADLPSTLNTVLSRLSKYVEGNEWLPSIIDPSGTNENLSDRWDQDGYTVFRNAVMRYATWVAEAFTESDSGRSWEKWKRVFGENFRQPKSSQISSVQEKSTTLPYKNTEQLLIDIGISEALSPKYKIRIDGRVMRKPGFRHYSLNSSGNRVAIGRELKFSVGVCNVPEPYNVLWKVKNNGDEAFKRDSVRGQIEPRGSSIQEPTAFPGPHYVECYIVKDGVCVAKDRQDVVIVSNRG